MKIAIVSDIHLGDESCRLLENGKLTDTYQTLKAKIHRFTDSCPLDYVVLNGDILDFSVSSFKECFEAAKPFFQAMAEDRLTRRIVYVPGNHDKHVWDAVEWEVSVIRELKEHHKAKVFKRTQPGLIDYSKGSIDLPGVRPISGTKDEYGTLFLEGLFEEGMVLRIILVYPNLYIKTFNDTYLITHGHMLETAWVLLSELLMGEPELDAPLGVGKLEEYNIPLTSMICTGVGQGGKVSKLFHDIQQQAKKGKTRRLRRLLENIPWRLDKAIEISWLGELLMGILLGVVGKVALSFAKRVKDSRYDRYFLERPSVRARFERFYRASCAQGQEEFKLPPPNKMIFGHTHEPYPAKAPFTAIPCLPLYNTGGWLKAEGKSAEVFFLDDNGELSSENVA